VPRRIAALALATLLPVAALSQTNLSLGGISADPTLPVEITADQLTADQASGQAVFSGNVRIGQGDLRLAAGEVTVIYNEATGAIARLRASGGVTFVTSTEAAEAANADYDLDAGTLTMTGNVLLTQGPSAISADRMTVNLTDGTARLDGNVRTVFQQGNN
jgi:lipopolysaccharide export system protein LptA